ncbi:MAG: hypothetical protein HYZ73_04755 [Elusimicrobia bacterium]|nr:hypothetical protein [Elusimicrobiota bacterium]
MDTVREERGDFQTVNLPLASALLAEIPGSALGRITPSPCVDGKRLIVIQYPPEREADVQRLVDLFHQRRLTVNLFSYNKAANLLRDLLHRPEEKPCPSTRAS